MNTREREEILKVMDALANALRRSMDVEFGLLCDSALAAYDALLAEESASSEGAEAVAWLVRGEGYSYPHPTREAAFSDCRAAFRGKPVEILPLGIIGPQPAQGEHEQRSCEGSERRPIADEVVELSNSLEEDAALLRGLIDGGDSDDDALDRIADSMERTSAFLKSLTNADAPASISQADSDALALESALPRGLPAGSDALIRLEIHSLREYATVSDDSAYGTLATSFVREHCDRIEAALATAEQPSCGQDARDAWQPIETAPKDETLVLLACADWEHTTQLGKPVPIKVGAFADGRWWIFGASWEPTHWCPIRPFDAAIAAQQRQGGGA